MRLIFAAPFQLDATYRFVRAAAGLDLHALSGSCPSQHLHIHVRWKSHWLHAAPCIRSGPATAAGRSAARGMPLESPPNPPTRTTHLTLNARQAARRMG
jgi:hypothetical protein